MLKLTEAEIARGVKSYMNHEEAVAFVEGANFAMRELEAKEKLYERAAARHEADEHDLSSCWRLFQKWREEQKGDQALCGMLDRWRGTNQVPNWVRDAMLVQIQEQLQAQGNLIGSSVPAYLTTIPCMFPKLFGMPFPPDGRDWGPIIRDRFIQDRIEGIPTSQIPNFSEGSDVQAA